jgi:hypothetical protein
LILILTLNPPGSGVSISKLLWSGRTRDYNEGVASHPVVDRRVFAALRQKLTAKTRLKQFQANTYSGATCHSMATWIAIDSEPHQLYGPNVFKIKNQASIK